MPGATSCQPKCVALPPARFRSSQDPQGERKSAPQDAHIPLGLPRPRPVPKSPRAASESSPSSFDASVWASSTPRPSDTPSPTNRCQVPAGSSSQQPKPLSLTELVNQAARREEELEAKARLSVCCSTSSPRISSRSASPRAAPFSPSSSSNSGTSDPKSRDAPRYSAAGRPPVPSSLRVAPYSTTAEEVSAPRASAAGTGPVPAAAAAATSSSVAAASPRASSPRAASDFVVPAGTSSKPPLSPQASAAAANRHSTASLFAAPHSATSSSKPAAAGAGAGSPRVSGFAAAAMQQGGSGKQPSVQVPISHPLAAAAVASDCASDDGSLTPESSLCSSASNSSLCSYGSIASSTWSSSSSAPKSILTRRSHSSSCSGSSSPCGAKHVRWRDGESVREDAGHDLVAVLLLHDSPEIRRMRKDTWPERSKVRSELTVTIPTTSSSASSSRGGSGSSSSSSAAVAGEGNGSNNPLVATVMDWKEKLRALSAERRAQRVAALQATWTAQQAQQQRQLQQQKEVTAAAAGAAEDSSSPEVPAAAGEEHAPAAAGDMAKGDASVQVGAGGKASVGVGGGGGAAVTGPVIHLQAVAASATPQACC